LLSRSCTVKAGLLLVATMTLGSPAPSRPAADTASGRPSTAAVRIEPVDTTRAPPVSLRHVHTHGRLTVTVFDGDGRLRPAALDELRRF
jgi:hypothetical protein